MSTEQMLSLLIFVICLCDLEEKAQRIYTGMEIRPRSSPIRPSTKKLFLSNISRMIKYNLYLSEIRTKKAPGLGDLADSHACFVL